MTARTAPETFGGWSPENCWLCARPFGEGSDPDHDDCWGPEFVKPGDVLVVSLHSQGAAHPDSGAFLAVVEEEPRRQFVKDGEYFAALCRLIGEDVKPGKADWKFYIRLPEDVQAWGFVPQEGSES